ncbi:MAG: aminoacyl-tRNA hydrolase [Oscillospiraceae bacterium]|nr:aminoacyl-tRNA hydrolase [Oscillospiraceae bacterium]
MFFDRSRGAPRWLVVCLGNPGPKYEGTRHNAGFMAADALSKKYGAAVNRLRFKSLTGTCPIGGETVMIMKPQTYMNLSGDAVIQAVRFYKIPADHVMVISDEMALPVGKIRIKTKGSAGGHNGLKSIIEKLGTEEFPRIRLGVGAPPHPDYDVKEWVLSVFRNQDAEDMAAAAEKAAEAVECYISEGAERAMNKYN